MNNRITQTDDKPPLILTYDVATTPPTLIPGENGVVTITLEASTTIICYMIRIRVPHGNDADDLFVASPLATLSPSNNDWSTGDPHHIHDAETQIQYQQWTLTNTVNNAVHKTEFKITGMVNTVGGTALIVIDEDSSYISTTYNFEQREGTRSVTKSSKPVFYLQNLIAIDYLSPQFPCGTFQLGYPIEISWEGNGTNYDLYQSGITTPIHSGPATNYTLPKGISDTTTFCCVASNDSGDKLFESLTLTVTNPALTAQTVTTSQEEEVYLDMNTNKGTCNRLNPGTNRITMANPAPNVNNLIDNSSTINLSGDFTVGGDATFSGILGCTGMTTDNLTIEESFIFNDQQDALFNPFVLVTSGTTVPFGYRYANTDGYAILTVSGPPAISGESVAYGSLGIAGILDWVYTYGGNTGGILSEIDGFLMIPVPAGANWQFHGENLITASSLTTINVFWFPIGNDSTLQNQGASAVPFPLADTSADKNHPRQLFTQYLAAKKQRRSDFVNSIEAILDTTLPAAIKEEMIQQLMKL